jgi:hypothetical protein
MTDQQDREHESRESPVTKFEEIRQEDKAERDDAAERLQEAPQPEDDS